MKTKFTAYRLHFSTSVHIGDARPDDYGVSQTTIASDTMYAALMDCWAKLGNTIPEDGDLGFQISSLFPFYQKDKSATPVYFLPRPPFKHFSPSALSAKDLKHIQWIDIPSFEEAVNKPEIVIEDESQVQKSYFSHQMIDADFISAHVVPRVNVSRSGEDAVPFYMDRLHFKDFSGLYFLAYGDTTRIDVAINLLQYEGIGTDRNVGNGVFVFDPDTVEIDIPSNSNYAMSLSVFIPESRQQLISMLHGSHIKAEDKVGYTIVRRGGWITTPPNNSIRKNAIYAFLQGSVFSYPIDKVSIAGKTVDLRPDVASVKHPIWRCGKSIFIPIIF